jgi:hypothetical protein
MSLWANTLATVAPTFPAPITVTLLIMILLKFFMNVVFLPFYRKVKPTFGIMEKIRAKVIICHIFFNYVVIIPSVF